MCCINVRIVSFFLSLAALIALAVQTPASAESKADEHGSAEEGSEEEQPKKKKAKPVPTVPLLDPRGAVDLVVCSQNLKLFGEYDVVASRGAKLSKDIYEDRVTALAKRFAGTECDVIAVQELIGRNDASLINGLEILAKRLRELTNRTYDVKAGPPVDGAMAMGFIVARDRAEILNTVSYSSVELPKLTPKQKPRLFTRSPLELQIAVASREGQVRKNITIVNFHFKSKRGAAGDPSGLEWETYRMEMSEALRRIVERRLKNAFASGESLLLLVGDRNSNFDVASAKILEGVLTLKSFQEEAPCRLTKRGAPICKAGETLPQRLFSVLTGNPRTRSLPGTFKYKDEYSWLDDILMPAESLPFAWDEAATEGVFDSGVVYEEAEASDHAMVYTKLNW